MLTYGTLEETPMDQIHGAFMEAFSDYQVDVQASYESFVTSMTRNGFSGRLSIGAFDNGKLVGFILNGQRLWNGEPTIYDLGTGVIPQMRKRGITSQMLDQTKKVMQEEKVEQYLLEVIQTNENALRLYQRKGFQINRELKCYHIQKE